MSIHQQATLPASPGDVYAIRADAAALSALSGMDGKSGLAEGGEFSLLTVDQYGYPEGADTIGCHETWHDNLSEGWGMFYLAPLARHFAGGTVPRLQVVLQVR